MKKNVFFIGFAVVVVAAVAFLLLRPEKSASPSDSEQTSRQASQPADNAAPAPQAQEGDGTYSDYSEAAFEASGGTRLLFFHADWCPQCRALDGSIKAASLPSGVHIFKVDYDSAQALRKLHGVTLQTTVVRVDGNGVSEEKFVAYDEPSYDAVSAALLE